MGAIAVRIPKHNRREREAYLDDPLPTLRHLVTVMPVEAVGTVL